MHPQSTPPSSSSSAPTRQRRTRAMASSSCSTSKDPLPLPTPAKRSRRRQGGPASPHKKSKTDNNDNDPFKTLPDEILIRILSYLNTPDLATRVSLVSRRFARLSSDPTLWRLLDLDRMRLDRRNAQRVIDRCTLLEELALGHRSDDCSLARRALENCPNLKTLHIYSCNDEGTRRRQGSLMKVIGRLDRSMRNLRWAGLHPEVLRANVKCLRHLECLQLSIDDGDDDHKYGLSVEALKAVAGVCNRLDSCYIAGEEDGGSADEEMNRFLDGVKDTMVDLDVDCQKSFTNASLKNVAKCVKLRRLSLDSPRMDGGNLRSFVELLPRLKSLEITFYRTDDGLSELLLRPEHFVDAFRGRRKTVIERLMITHCDGMDDESLTAIAEGCPRINYLSIAYCKNVTDKGLESVLDKCGDLVKLDVRGLDDLTREPFVKAVSAGTCPNKLKELFCEYDQGEMREVEDVVPGLKVDVHYPHSCFWSLVVTY